MVVQENKKFETFEEFYRAIIFQRNIIILPDSRTFHKGHWVTRNGFDIKGFNNKLIDIYNNEFKK